MILALLYDELNLKIKVEKIANDSEFVPEYRVSGLTIFQLCLELERNVRLLVYK